MKHYHYFSCHRYCQTLVSISNIFCFITIFCAVSSTYCITCWNDRIYQLPWGKCFILSRFSIATTFVIWLMCVFQQCVHTVGNIKYWRQHTAHLRSYMHVKRLSVIVASVSIFAMEADLNALILCIENFRSSCFNHSWETTCWLIEELKWSIDLRSDVSY